MDNSYRNPGYFFLLLALFVLAGFYYPYFSLVPHFAPNITALVHIHAAALMLWVVLLVLQPLLIGFRKRQIHKGIGLFTYLLVPLIVLTSIGVMHKQFGENTLKNVGVSENLRSLFVSFGELVLFSAFYALAVLHRRSIAPHMRYMILTGLVLITPSLGRVLGYWFDVAEYPAFLVTFVLVDAILIALVAIDWRRLDCRRPYLVGLVLSLLFHLTWLALGHPTDI
jgi:hypothetical protein